MNKKKLILFIFILLLMFTSTTGAIFQEQVVEDIIFKGTTVYEESQLIDFLGIDKGEKANIEQISQGLTNIEEKLFEDGYIPTKIFDQNYTYIDFYNTGFDNGVLNINLGVGILNDIIFKGNQKTKDHVILREFNFEKGEIVSFHDIQKDLQKLFMLNYFKEIYPRPEIIQGTNKFDLIIEFEERDTGSFNFGGGYNTRSGWMGMLNLQENNLLGYGQQIDIKWEFGRKDKNFTFDFFEPRLKSSDFSLGLNYYYQTEDFREDFQQKKHGGGILLGHPITATWDGNIRFKLERIQREYDDEDIEDYSGQTRSVTFDARHDSRNHGIFPTQGSLHNISLEIAGSILGGDHHFQKVQANLRRYYPGFAEDHAWAFRLRGGTVFGETDIEQFRLGGSESLRGYQSFSFKGNNMILGNVEYRIPLHDYFTGVIFADTGNAWDEGKFSFGDLNTSAGLGVRVNTPLGMVRIDYGMILSEENRWERRPHFSFGHTF